MDLMSRIEPTLGSLEEEYRLTFLKDDMRRSSIGIVIWILYSISFAYNDYLFFGNTGQFWLLAFCRSTLVSYGIVLLFVFTKLERVAIYERLVFIFLIVAALFVFYVNTTRPSPYQMNATLDVLMVFAVYLLFPNNLRFRILSAFLMSLCALLTAIFYRTFSVSPAMVTMFLSLILANAAGISISARSNRLRRGRFEALTQIKQREESLRQSEEMLSLALDGANLGIWEWNLNTGKAIWSERTRRMLGYAPNEFGSNLKNWKKLVHPEDWPRVSETLNLHLEGKLPKLEVVYRALNKFGEWQWSQAQGKVTGFDSDGKPIRITGVVADVTDRQKAEEALRDSEAKYKVLVEESFDGIFVQKQTEIVFTNSRLREMLGYEEGELEGQYHWLVYHPEYQQMTRERAKARLRGQPAPSRYEVRMQRKDGSSFDAEINAKVVQVTGEPGIQVWVRDISERKQAENAIRESEERFRTAFQTSPDAVAITRLSDGVCIEANNGFTEITGFTREEVIGKSLLELNIWHDPGDRDRLTAELKERGHVTNLEGQFRLKDGLVRTGLMSARIIVLGGEPHILSVSRDVEDWKKAEQALRESEEKYRTLFEESRDAVIMTTRDGVVEDVNQAFLDLFGYTREEAHHMDILNIYVDHADRRRFQEDIEREGSVKDYPIKRRKKDGTEIDCLITSTARRARDGTIVGYQGIVRDVTEHKQLQRQLLQAQKMEAIGTLAGGIAHDFNNLLQVTMGYSEVLLSKKDKADPEYTRLQQILQASRSGTELVQRLLTLSRKTESKQRPIDLNHQIEQARRLLGRTIPKMIKIELHLAEFLATVNADPTQIEQVIMNLAVNARDAMPEGGKLTLCTENVILDEDYCRVNPGAKPGKCVLLAISDSGSGMDKEILDHMFEPFFTTKGLGMGTGLGLAVVYGIVKQHAGYVTCESQPAQGTVFRVYLPAIEEQEIVSDELVEEPKLPGGTETILFVDDEDVVRDLGELILSESGYKVLTAKNGKEAREIYLKERESISLVILDLIMPEMGGTECLKELLKIDPQVKVLVASGYSADASVKETIQMGAKGFVTKPFRVKELLRDVRKVLDES